MTAFAHPLIQTRKKLKVIYYGDPICSTCWVNEPYIRKLAVEYSDYIDIEHRMGGLLESIDAFQRKTQSVFRPEELKNLWDTTSEASGMNMDGDIWLEQPIESSYPPSLAYYAAQKQGMTKALLFLRILREMLFLKKKDISQEYVIKHVAKIAELDMKRFMRDFHSSEIRNKFKRDIQDKELWNVQQFPTLVFVNDEGEWEKVEGTEDYPAWEEALVKISKQPIQKQAATYGVFDLLSQIDFLASKEIAVILDRSVKQVEQELEALYLQGRIIKESYSHSNFWRKKDLDISIIRRMNGSSKAIIIGGGMAGLTTAINLKKMGFKAKIFERRPPDGRRGLGFLMLKNGIDALNLMGLGNKIKKIGNPINYFMAFDLQQNVIAEQDLNDFLALRRGDCIEMLTNELEEEDIAYNKNFSHFENNKNGEAIGVHFKDGTAEYGDLIIGADGVRSQVRRTLYSGYELEPVGYKEIVCMVDLPELQDNIRDTFFKLQDEDLAMGLVPFGHGKYVWFLQFKTSKHYLNSNDADLKRKFVMKAIKHFPPTFKQVADLSDFSQAYFWDIRRMKMLPKFNKNGVILIGDAAHPLISLTSQGANSAIEDSVLLSHFLSKYQSIDKMKKCFSTFTDFRYKTIDGYTKEGDALLEQFLGEHCTDEYKAPFTHADTNYIQAKFV